jgi:hypothetical protein
MKTLLTLLFGIFLYLPLMAETSQRQVMVEGHGVDREESIQNGLLEALKQVKGFSIDAVKISEQSILDIRTSSNGVNKDNLSLREQSKGQIQEKTRGMISSYQIIDAERQEDGSWVCHLDVQIADYKTPGHSPDSRRKLAVLPFRMGPP